VDSIPLPPVRDPAESRLHSVVALARRMQVMDHVHDSVVATTLDGYIASWNRGAEKLHGYSAAEAVGRHVSFIYPPDEQERVFALRARLMEAGFLEYDATALNKAGDRHPIHARLHVIPDETGVAAGVLSFAIDTTELHRTREDLRHRERQLTTLLNALPLAVTHVDPSLAILFANRGCERFYGKVGRTLPEVLGPDYVHVQPHVEAALAGRPHASVEEVVGPRGNPEVYSVRGVPDVDSDGTVSGCFLIAIDIADERAAEARRLEEERRLRDALVAEVHHRVKNSLQGVVGLLRDHSLRHPELADALDPAIAQLLAVAVGFGLMSSRRGGGQGLVLCEMVREIATNITQITGAEIRRDIAATVLAQPVAVEQMHAVNIALVLNELMFNAVKHARAREGAARVRVVVDRDATHGLVDVSSDTEPLPPGFDFDGGNALGTGLSLVRLLLPPTRSTLAFEPTASGITARLRVPLGSAGREVACR
jgi:PAS domain S-box-containing protein